MQHNIWLTRHFALTIGCFMVYVVALYNLGYSITWWVVVLVLVLSPVIPGILVGVAIILLDSGKYKEK
ncbi:hypothetical protein SJS42_16925 [Aeromonas caviae]|uniref:Uncharacterized protein n=1 Tax=Aeromonas veronii TaxID=654 RepID=A0AAW5M9Z6_AERVE|nr:MULTISPECIES: hypothetical protein [Aeromonas]MCR4450750.1 hypothetical protein [Aeromonas veronii]MDX7800318.1 hypothetical protein [Aeromonas caviae]